MNRKLYVMAWGRRYSENLKRKKLKNRIGNLTEELKILYLQSDLFKACLIGFLHISRTNSFVTDFA